ncbi:hypothetical protein DIE23_24540 [Burkholderia sp. Bp9143]|nr:hypothetical protein DIE23_24540 [Burkholderia sp. Bp9143]
MSKRAWLILYVTGVLAIFNFFVFWSAAAYLGGDAVNGCVQDLHYIVCAHGSCHGVTKSIWEYSYWHAISTFAGKALDFVDGAILMNTGDIVIDFDADV